MNKTSKIVSGVAVVALVIAIIALFTPVGSKSIPVSTGSLGGTSNYDTLGVTGLQVGPNCNNGLSTFCTATTIADIQSGQCYIKAYATTIAATTSAAVDCQANAASSISIAPLNGVLNGDNVQASLSTSTAGTTYGGIVIAGASASTTAGYITLRIENLTGTTFTWPTTGTATGTVSYITTR